MNPGEQKEKQRLAIRPAQAGDLAAIRQVYAAARRFMVENGNPSQWGDGFPPQELLETDLREGRLYVMMQGERVCAAFVLALGEDPTYREIEQGEWLSDSRYGTIHRLASDGSCQGVFERCVAFCREQWPHLRVDTHQDNRVMRHLIERAGFRRCGIIHVADGSPRIAYELLPAGSGRQGGGPGAAGGRLA